MSEYLQNVGRRAELRQTAVRLKIAVDSHRESLRLALDPTADAADLDAEKILVLAAALAEKLTELRAAEEGVRAIEKIIGK